MDCVPTCCSIRRALQQQSSNKMVHCQKTNTTKMYVSVSLWVHCIKKGSKCHTDCRFVCVAAFVNKAWCASSCLIPPAYYLTQLLPLPSPLRRVCQTDIWPALLGFVLGHSSQWVCGSPACKSEGAPTRLWWKHSLITHLGVDCECWHIRTKGIKI